MPPARVGLPSDPKPMDRPNPLSRPHLVKLRRRGRSVSTAPKPPVSGYNPFCSESESDPVQQRMQSWRPFDLDATFSGPGASESSSQDPAVTSVFGFSSSTNADKGTNSSSSTKDSGDTGSGPFDFGNSTQKSSESNLKDGKENEPVFVFGAPENLSASSNLPEKLQTWHPFNSCAESKENDSKGDASVSGEKLKGKLRSEEEFLAENGTVREGGGSDPSSSFTFGGGNSVPDSNDVAENADSLREKLEKTVHISSSAVPEDKDESVIGKFTKEKSDSAANGKEEVGTSVPGYEEGPTSKLPEEMKKLNLQNAKTRSSLENRDADILPEKVEKLNLGSESGNLETKPPVFIFGANVNESTGSSQTSSKSTHSAEFAFGSSPNIYSDNMKNFNTSKEREYYTPGAFSFNFQDWERETKTRETTLPDAMKKLEIGARKKVGLRGKKKPTRPGNSTMACPHAPSLVPEYNDRATSSEKDEQVPVKEPVLGSPAGFSPMDYSPYPENYASDNTHRSTSLEVDAEKLAKAAERLELKEENLNENERHRMKEGHEKEIKGEGDKISASGIDLNLEGSTSGPTFAAFNMEDAEESEIIDMDYVAMGNNVSGSCFRFTSSTTTQGPLPVHRRHFRRKNRVTRPAVESTEDQVRGSSVQPTSQLANESTPHVRTKVDRGRQEARNRRETKEATSASGGALESCEKWRMRGNQAYADGRLQKAEEYYTRGINSLTTEERSGSCARALMLCFSNRAATRMSLGRMREAFVDCLIALETDPGFFRACVRAANCLLALGEVEEATKYYNRCIQSDGVDSKILTEAREGLGKAEKFTQYVEQAMQLLQKGTSTEVARVLELISDAMLIGSNSDNLIEMKAKALLLLSKYEEVIELCEHSSDLAEKNSNLGRSSGRDPRLWRWVLVAKSYFYLGKLDEALQVLKKYEEVKPTDERSQEICPSPAVIAELLRLKASGNEAFQAGKYAEAVESYTAALTYNSSSRPFSAICFGNRAAAYQAQGQIMDAIADCSMAIALDPNYVKAISRRATLYETIRDYGQAASDLRRLISLLEKQSPGTQTASHGKSSKSNTELHRASVRLSSMEEEARKRTPLNMYLILGIEKTSSAADIKKAYRKAALRHHPDKAGQFLVKSETVDDIVQEIQRDADHLFKIIGEAYNVLSDDTKRLKYDMEEDHRSGKRSYDNGYEEHNSKPHYYEKSSSRRSSRSHHHWSDDFYW